MTKQKTKENTCLYYRCERAGEPILPLAGFRFCDIHARRARKVLNIKEKPKSCSPSR